MNRKTALFSIFWLATAGGLYWYFSGKLNPNTAQILGERKEIVLKRDPSGHYHAEAFINGEKSYVLIDTGATDVAISQNLANKLGARSVSAVRVQTANGDSVSYLVRLNSVKLGGIEAENVAATITPNLSGVDALIGMSFLSRMDVRLHRGEMIIRQDESP